MAGSRIPKQRFYGELHHGRRKVGRKRKRYCNKASLIVYLKDFNISTSTWENAASDSSTWRSMIHKGATHAEALRINADKDKCRTRKARALTDGDMPPTHFFHQSCGRDFCTHIGLINHMLSYRTSLNTLLLWSYSIRNDEQQQHTQKSNSTSYYSYPTDPTFPSIGALGGQAFVCPLLYWAGVYPGIPGSGYRLS